MIFLAEAASVLEEIGDGRPETGGKIRTAVSLA